MNRSTTALLVVLLSGASIARADDGPTIADVKKAWTARQDAHKSFRVEWVETITHKAGSIGDLTGNVPGPHPPQDAEVTAVRSFAADGDRLAFSNEQALYLPRQQSFVPLSSAAFFDIKTATHFTTIPGDPGWTYVRVYEGKLTPAAVPRTSAAEAVSRLYRPVTGGLSTPFEFDKFTVSQRTQKIGGVGCVEIAPKDPPKGGGLVLWCDPERDFLPLRTTQRTERGGYDLDCEYRKDDKGRWTLTGWRHTALDAKGAARTITKAEVKKPEFAPKFAPEAFAPKPPVSSNVTVYDGGETKENYLIRADGSKRVIAAAEFGKDNADLAKTNADGTPYVPKK